MKTIIKDRSEIFKVIFDLIGTDDDSQEILKTIDQIVSIDTMVIDAEIDRLKSLKRSLAKVNKQYLPEKQDRDLQTLLSLDAQVEDVLEQSKLLKSMFQQHNLMLLQKSLDYMAEHGILTR